MAYNKKQNYFVEAERLYVVEGMNLDDIAARINISTRSLSDWKKEGEWERKKAALLAQKNAFHEELYDFSRVLLRRIKTDIENGDDPSTGQLYTLTNLLSSIGKVKIYEDQKESEKPKIENIDKKQRLMASIEEIIGA